VVSVPVDSVEPEQRSARAAQTWLRPLQLTWEAKGPVGLVDRFRTVSTRFGPTPERMLRRLRAYADFGARTGVAPTWPITATVLARNPASIRPFLDDGVEFAIHGLYHNDHSLMPARLQLRDICLAQAAFRRAGIPAVGFRAPYLRANEDTATAVAAAGLAYLSNQAVVFRTLGSGLLPSQQRTYARALTLYDAHDADVVACRPEIRDALVHIPVTIPDDEILVDRLGLTPQEQGAVWGSMLETIHERGDLFTIQLHPERWSLCASAVATVVSSAAQLPGGVWTACLHEIASWWAARAACQLEVEWVEDGGVEVSLKGDPRAVLLVRRDIGPESVETSRRVTLVSHRLPSIGVAADASPRLVQFLSDEGYAVKVGASPDECTVYLDRGAGELTQMSVRRRIAAAPGPLVRIAPWPQGRRSALALSGDIDALTFQDFVLRIGQNAWQSRAGAPVFGWRGN
jgi:peptidoglycan/xylan/chitin deacetylase (PgdA/CDA1 family)